MDPPGWGICVLPSTGALILGHLGTNNSESHPGLVCCVYQYKVCSANQKSLSYSNKPIQPLVLGKGITDLSVPEKSISDPGRVVLVPNGIQCVSDLHPFLIDVFGLVIASFFVIGSLLSSCCHTH